MTARRRAPSSTSVPAGRDGQTVERTTLPCGLRVVTEELPTSRSASVGLWVGVGSRDETPEHAGAAHYLEHLLFKGTERRSATDIAEAADLVGGELNAFTAKEHTCYYAHMLDTDADLAVDLVSDVVLNAVCAPEHHELERGVVLDELAMRDDDPEDVLHDEFAAAMLGDHPLGRPVIGTVDSITGMTRDRLYGFYRERYTVPRMVLAAAGNVTHEQVLGLVDTAFGSLLDGAAEPAAPRRGTAEPGPGAERLVLREDDTEQAHLMLGVAGISRHDDRRFALGVLNAALGGGMSSRLFQEVRERRGLAYSVYSSVATYADTGHVSFYTGCSTDHLAEVVSVLRAVLRDVAAHGVTDAEVARGKGQLRGGLVLGLEDTGSRMVRIGKTELNFAEQLSVEEQLDRIEAVTPADVAALAAELLRRPVSGALVGPYASADDLPAELLEVIA